ncbi:MAG: prepilin-type N-terminal cleavage/methylation domain-containing protein [Candidatus Paceibacterota bacterium]|jgi:type II secretory pathway pseudopilin PulG
MKQLTTDKKQSTWAQRIFATRKSAVSRQSSVVSCARTRAFTLVEMIIYAAIFSFISIVAVNGVIVSMKSFYNIRLSQNINQSATVAMDRMAYEIRNAYNIDSTNSTLGTSPGRLTLLTEDANGNSTTVEFYVIANQLNMRVGGVDQGPLLVKTSILTNLIFLPITTPNSKAVKIEMTAQDSRQDATKTAKYYDTIVLRGSIH